MDALTASIMNGATPSFETFLEEWGDWFPLLQRLQDTPQESEWHAEGDVRIHTTMVLEETYSMLTELDLSAERRLALVLAALFHDVAKPITTRLREVEGRERIVAPRHAEMGRSYLAYRIHRLGLPWQIAHEIMALVAYHHEPKRLVRSGRSARYYRRLARLADIGLLYHLEIADMRGRRCSDQDEQLNYIELFRLYAEDHGVFGKRRDVRELYPGWSEHIHEELEKYDETTRKFVFRQAVREVEAGEIFTPHEAVAKSYQYREEYAQLLVLCGPSGAGKSTWVNEKLAGWAVVSLDDLRAELTGDATDQSKNGQVRQLSRDRLKEHLRNNRRVVWDATNLRRDFRQMPLGLGFAYGAFTTLVVFQVPPEECMRRNQGRERQVPTSVLERQIESAQWPSLDEAHEVVFLDSAGEEVAWP